MKTTEITFTYKNNADYSFEFTTGNDLEDAIAEFIGDTEELNDSDNEEISKPENWEVTDWGEVSEYVNLCDFDVLQEIAEEDIDNDWDVISAGIEAGIDIDNIDEAYAGEYKDDEDFAWEQAESMGAIDKHANWPMNCIDWEYAAKELMYDYSEANGHYFRNF